jgi:hypothetical protein
MNDVIKQLKKIFELEKYLLNELEEYEIQILPSQIVEYYNDLDLVF